jgi:hypothetical protein
MFGSLETKDFVASQLRSPYYFLDLKATRLGSLMHLWTFCRRRMSENQEPVVSDADSVDRPNLNADDQKYGAIFV